MPGPSGLFGVSGAFCFPPHLTNNVNQHQEIDTVRLLCARIPELSAERFRMFGRKFVRERQDFVASLLLDAYTKRRKHRHTSGALALSRDEIVDGLRISDVGGKYKEILTPFFDFPEGNSGYSMQAKRTKPYTVRASIRERVDAALTTDDVLSLVWMRDGRRVSPPPKVSANGIPKPLASRLFVPRTFPLSIEQVDRAVQSVEQRTTLEGSSSPLNEAKPNGTTIGTALAQLRIVRHWVRATGGLSNQYREQSQGRLGPLSSGHIIQLPAALRRLLLKGSELVEYDLVSCHLSVFLSLGPVYGFETGHTEAYVRDKSAVHAKWSALTGHDQPHAFKSIIVSFLNGGKLSASQHTASGRLLGAEAMRRFMGCPHAQALQREIREGIKAIVTRETKEHTAHSLVNAVGCTLRLNSTTSMGKRSAHLLTGYEQFSIREMLAGVEGVQGIIYDGFLARSLDTTALEQRVTAASTAQLGFPLTVKLRAESFNASPPITP